MNRDAYTVLGLLALGIAGAWIVKQARRWRLRLKLRKRLKAYRMIPVLAVLWATVEVRSVIAQAPADSLIGTVLSRNVIPAEWKSGQIGIYCLTWVAEREDRPRLLVIIDAAPADPNADPLCPDGRGGFYPLWVDGPYCPPGQVSPFTDRDFVLIRCGNQNISRYRRPMPVLKRTGDAGGMSGAVGVTGLALVLLLLQ